MYLPQSFASKSGFPYLVDIKISDFCPFGCEFCLPPETLVKTPNGEKRIDEIKINELVYSIDANNMQMVTNPVEKIYTRFVNEEIFDIELEDGRIISSTKEHPFFVDGEWIEAQSLKEDMCVVIYGETI